MRSCCSSSGIPAPSVSAYRTHFGLSSSISSTVRSLRFTLFLPEQLPIPTLYPDYFQTASLSPFYFDILIYASLKRFLFFFINFSTDFSHNLIPYTWHIFRTIYSFSTAVLISSSYHSTMILSRTISYLSLSCFLPNFSLLILPSEFIFSLFFIQLSLDGITKCSEMPHHIPLTVFTSFTYLSISIFINTSSIMLLTSILPPPLGNFCFKSILPIHKHFRDKNEALVTEYLQWGLIMLLKETIITF